MKKILLALAVGGGLLMARPLHAQELFYTSVSSVTWCAVSVSATAPTRVDNFNAGCTGLMDNRTGVKIVNGGGTLHIGFSTALSTQTSSAFYGETLAASEKTEWAIGSNVKLYLMSESGTQQVVVYQARVTRPTVINAGGIGH